VSRGHEVIERNWKTKYCEVDIISMKDEIVYFTEVKYREVDRWGGGVDAITEKKENQMRFAARFWLESEDMDGEIDAKLSVISLSGDPPRVEHYIPDIDR
jgi:Holliday junction resolvase-like predicted endonuclease